jgi:hypothetical protein
MLATDASAYVYIGNPIVTVVATRLQGDLTTTAGHLDTLRVHKCAGGYVDYEVDQTIDLVDGWTSTIAPGDYCGVSLHWGSSLEISNGSWTAEYDEPYTAFPVDGLDPVAQSLTPFTITSGTFSGNAPKLVVTVD